ncbi:MAG: multidrug efflux system membrane fusion protein [Planctomycetota bacterium]|jgi:multidrug efflux system membrane fusion protein
MMTSSRLPDLLVSSLRQTGGILSLALLGLAAASCSSEPEEAPPAIPTVRVLTVGKTADGQIRRVSGRVEAVDQSTLSFGVSVKVVAIEVLEGQEVIKGQLIARLDDATLTLAVNEANTSLTLARAALVEAKAAYDRTKALTQSGGASQQELDSATATLANADAAVANAETAVARAQIDLKRTKLFAPFHGKIVSLNPDLFQEVGASETMAVIQSDGALMVEVLVPETLIRDVDFGQVVKVSSPTLPDETFQATVTRIGAESAEGNAYPVTVRLADGAEGLRPGMTAGVTFQFDAYLEGKTAYLIPLSCLAVDALAGTGDRDEKAPVFILDPTTEKVTQIMVQVGNLRGNEIEVYEGLEPGDLIVSAGVAFLRDGMSATAWTPRR